ncbi:DUF6233 domain-containing protein [Streptomyces sp. NPDC059153]|uniref:DUF6233 domain-containing protein n=1 Tax=Streptomyces sp. NPDC059153 TaxID=3346743 RepID=UPI00369A20B6
MPARRGRGDRRGRTAGSGTEARRGTAPAPDWLVERSIGQGASPIEVHVGGCYMARNIRAVTREQALQATLGLLRHRVPPPVIFRPVSCADA